MICANPASGWSMTERKARPITLDGDRALRRAMQAVIGRIPYRMAFAGGWIDQPFMSRLNPEPSGSMVVVGLEPEFFFMERCGMATGTRNVALRCWGPDLPRRGLPELVHELYRVENQDKPDPSGSQDMIGLIYPGINRLDYAADYEGGYFPAHIESCTDSDVARWLEQVIYMLPVMQRPPGYNPLENMNLSPDWARRLGQSGRDCYAAILNKDIQALGASFNECMHCWETLLPATVRHETIGIDLVSLLEVYQARYPGAMYSGCGGGYLLVVSDQRVPGAFQVKVRTSEEAGNHG